jgi:hypothetical protein
MVNAKDKCILAAAAELRRRAEKLLKTKIPETIPPQVDDEPSRLLHELQVHQIELEMQNAELLQSRDKLEIALENYSDLYDFAPVGYLTLDRNGVIRTTNLTGAGLIGIERAKLLCRRFEALIQDDARFFFTEFLEKVIARQGKDTCEVTLVSDGVDPRIVQIEASAVSEKECRIVLIDITARKQAEEALAEKRKKLEELNGILEDRVNQAVSEVRLKDQMLILQGRQAAMGEMINNIAHQWRQPLNTLGILIQGLPLFYDSAKFSKEYLKENSNQCMELIQHMSRTIDDFINFFKPDKEAVFFSVNQVIENTLTLIDKSFKAEKISIDYHKEGDPLVTGYPNEYSQVLLNILMNARDVLTAKKVADALISINLFTERDRSVVTVTDNGCGIPNEIIDKVFDPYFTTKGPDKGTGIGLFMSKSIIEKNMGGRLMVCNTGQGAEFRIEI